MAKLFKNFSAEDFSWKHNGVEFNFPAGKEIYLEDDKAEHFAKHLVDREMNRGNEQHPKGIPTNNKQERMRFEVLCFPSDEVVSSQDALDKNERAKAKPRAKKVAKEFEDLDDK